MQSIDPAANLTAVPGPAATPVMAQPPVATPDPAAKAASGAVPGPKRTADVAAFGSESFAVYSIDEKTRATRIAIYDGSGRLVRLIPPKNVSDMLSQLAAYRHLR